MSPKRRKSPERTQSRKAKTTRPDRLIELLAEAIEDACLVPREIRMPQRLALGDSPGDDDHEYKATAERYEREREAARGRVIAAARKLLAAWRDALPDLEEQEAREIEAAAACMELQTVDPYEGYRESRFDLCAPRLNELAARLRVRAAKMQAPVHAATPETQAGETRRTVLFQDNFEKVCILTPTGRRGVKADLRPSPLTILLKRLFTEWEKNPETRLEWTGALQKEIGYGEQVEPGKDARPSRRWRDPNKKTPGRTKILNKIIEDTRDDISGPWKVRLNPRFKYTVKHP